MANTMLRSYQEAGELGQGMQQLDDHIGLDDLSLVGPGLAEADGGVPNAELPQVGEEGRCNLCQAVLLQELNGPQM